MRPFFISLVMLVWLLFASGLVSAADRWWDGTASTDPTNVNNWSDTDGGATPASSVPGAADHAHFTANGDGNACTLTANWALGDLTTLVGYTSKLDLATFDVTFSDGGNCILDQGGECDCGTGTITLINGDFDNQHVGTYTRGTSTLVMNGTGTLTSASANSLYDLTIAVDAVITVDQNAQCSGTMAVNGTLSINTSRTFYSATVTTTTIGAAGRITGSGTYYVYAPGAGEGITSFTLGGVVDIAELLIYQPNTAAILAPGTYSPTLLRIRNAAAAAYTLTLSAGDYVFTGDLEFENTNAAGSLTVANDTNNPDIELRADLAWDEQAGTITWTKGTGDVTLSGTADQDIDFGDEASENLTIDKPTSGNVTLNNVDLVIDSIDAAGNLAVVTGDVDTATSATCNITGNVVLDGNAFDLGDTTTWTVTGNFDCKDVTAFERGTSTLVMDGTGTLTVSSAKILNNLTIAAGAVITANDSANVYGTTAVNGEISVSAGKTFYSGGLCATTIGAAGKITGDGTYYVYSPGAGEGITSFAIGGVVDVATLGIHNPNAAAVIAPGTYQSALVKIDGSTASAYTLTLSAGNYTFTGNVEFEVTSTGDLTLANNTHGPTSITIDGDLTFDLDNAGDFVVDDSGQAVAWDLVGDVVHQQAAAGELSWTAGTGTITISGTGDAAIDFNAQSTEPLTISKTDAATVIFGDDVHADITCTGTSMWLNFGGHTHHGDLTINVP